VAEPDRDEPLRDDRSVLRPRDLLLHRHRGASELSRRLSRTTAFKVVPPNRRSDGALAVRAHTTPLWRSGMTCV
jgi:hypothetical protein